MDNLCIFRYNCKQRKKRRKEKKERKKKKRKKTRSHIYRDESQRCIHQSKEEKAKKCSVGGTLSGVAILLCY